LPCCLRDADEMKNALRSMGFHTQCEKDLRAHRTKEVSRHFVESIQPGAIALFYFSGHGFQYNGLNYLVPVDNDSPRNPSDMDKSHLNVQKLIDSMEKRKPKLMIIILDACRSDDALKGAKRWPDKTVTPTRPGLALMRAPPGTIIAYSCAADEFSYGESKYGSNSVYTYHLLRYIKTPNMDIDLVLRLTAAGVQKETKNQQTPFRYSSCNELMCLAANSPAANQQAHRGGLQRGAVPSE
jgi:uncharacterized caspase-like protein